MRIPLWAVLPALVASLGAQERDLETGAGKARMNPKDGQRYVWIPPGSFQMGCSAGDNQCDSDEKPAHAVTITKGFWLGQTEVTVEAYRRFAQATGRNMPDAPGGGSTPIVNVTWDDARAYCGWAGGRLPTEAEWEYAARAGSTEARYGPLDQIAWHGNNSGVRAHPVGEKQPNRFGFNDMLGNVWEWVADWYAEKYYEQGEGRDPLGPPSGGYRVLRGGSWYDVPRDARASLRVRSEPGYLNYNVGVRCVGE